MGNKSFRQKIGGFIHLIRSFTLLAPLIVSISIMAASFFYNGRTENIFIEFWYLILPAGFSLALLNAASNALNQVTDVEADRISKPYRPIPKGEISVHEAMMASIILYVVAIFLSALIHLVFSAIVLLIAFFTITYSLPPRFKNLLFINQLWVAIPRGLLGILASWSVFGDPLQPLPITIASIAMFFLIGGSITKDITDSTADRTTGTKTLVNTFGVKKAAFIAFPFMFFPFTIIPLLITAGVMESSFWLLTFLAIPGYFIFYLMIRDQTESIYFENTSAWALMYVTYFFFASSFSLLTIVNSVVG